MRVGAWDGIGAFVRRNQRAFSPTPNPMRSREKAAVCKRVTRNPVSQRLNLGLAASVTVGNRRLLLGPPRLRDLSQRPEPTKTEMGAEAWALV